MSIQTRNLPYPLLIAFLAVLVVSLFILSLMTGYTSASFSDQWHALFSNEQSLLSLVMWEIRMPRTLLGAAIGAILGLSGAVLQGLLRNPLAEPGVLGINAAASLGAVAAIYSGLSAWHIFALPISALIGAGVAVALISILVGGAGFNILVTILAGVALSSMAGALTALILNLSPDPFAALEIVFWMMGSLTDRSMLHVGLAIPFIAVGAVLLFSTARSLDALSLGQDVAVSLGVNVNRTRLLAILGTAIGVGAATSVSGAIGFVGLVVPHILRPLVGNRPSRLLPVSLLGGAAFLLAADILVRIILPSKDLKLGVITALIGVPFFIWLLVRVRKIPT